MNSINSLVAEMIPRPQGGTLPDGLIDKGKNGLGFCDSNCPYKAPEDWTVQYCLRSNSQQCLRQREWELL